VNGRPGDARYQVSLATSEAEVQEAQRLRYHIFVAESGRAAFGDDGIEADRFDPFCEHVLVRDRESGAVVGTYRLLGDTVARQTGGFYSETEFDMSRIVQRDARILELGRACVHPEHRNGSVIGALISGVLSHAAEHRYDVLVGCASFPVADRAAQVARTCRDLLRDHPGPASWRAEPYQRFTPPSSPADDAEPVPPLVRVYLRMGATVCSEPAWDPVFRTADLLLVLEMAALHRGYRSRFVRRAA
jgi:putative hemolysin